MANSKAGTVLGHHITELRAAHNRAPYYLAPAYQNDGAAMHGLTYWMQEQAGQPLTAAPLISPFSPSSLVFKLTFPICYKCSMDFEAVSYGPAQWD
jgi:hypothetical protein